MRGRAPIISMAVAILAGILVLLGYFLPIDGLLTLRQTLVQWGMVIAAFALIVGVVNLIQTHLAKIRSSQPGAVYSVVILLSFVITVVVVSWFSPTGDVSMWIFNNIQVPIEGSLMALLAIVLAYASARLLFRRPTVLSIIFVLTVLLVLIGSAPLFFASDQSAFIWLRAYITQWFTVGGARGLLLGVALGAVAAAVRILVGSDRPYGG